MKIFSELFYNILYEYPKERHIDKEINIYFYYVLIY